jgi:3-oxoadipate enol-lactonase
MDDARKQQFAAMSARIAAEGMTPLREGYLAGLYPESLRALDHERFVQYRARWSCNDPAAFSRLIGLLEKVDTLSIYASITCETLVLSGTLDMSRPVEMGRAVAAMIPGARFEVLETGHFMAVQTPELFAQAVRDFVTTTSGRTG